LQFARWIDPARAACSAHWLMSEGACLSQLVYPPVYTWLADLEPRANLIERAFSFNIVSNHPFTQLNWVGSWHRKAAPDRQDRRFAGDGQIRLRRSSATPDTRSASEGPTVPSTTPIADDGTDLVDGTQDAPINETVDGTIVGGFPAWTGTEPDGTPSANNCNNSNNWCNNWTTRNGAWSGDNGYTLSVDSGWTTGTTVCGNYAAIYCFGQ
jgi:hypothetical protein